MRHKCLRLLILWTPVLIGTPITNLLGQNNPDPLQEITYQNIKNYNTKEIINIISNKIFSGADKIDLDQLGISFSKQLSKESLSDLLDAYFNEQNPNIKHQLGLLVLHTYDNSNKEILKESYNDPRVKSEEGHEFFFVTLFPILKNANNRDINSVLQFISEQKIVDGGTYALQGFNDIQEDSLLNAILDMDSPYLESPLTFQIALGKAMGTDSTENTERIKRILNHALQSPNSPVCQGLVYLLLGAFYDMTQLKRPINIEAYDIIEDKKTLALNTDWDKKFKEKLEIWDREINNPQRVKKIKEIENQSILEVEIEGAKSRYAIRNEKKLNGTIEVKFEDIRNYLSEFRGTDYKSIADLEKEAGRKISSLGTYPTEENTFEGKPIEWGEPLNQN
jgi:hypothetical protein